MVGKRLAGRLVELGNEVLMGSRTPDNPEAVQWAGKAGKGASHGTFEEAARFGDILFLCVKGDAALGVIKLAKAGELQGENGHRCDQPPRFFAGDAAPRCL